uniref:receptor like protein kinase S.2-like n=1 Tax=Erigeron canadensis TaxID=72917 RepID=UPI001CB9B2D0|nr:receptor like protein kinase S.2-like [Erigeron canadensis]
MFTDSGNGKQYEASTSSARLPQRCCQFKFDEILLATDNFSESLVVGKGGFGKVYKGNIRIGTTHVDVAIKRMDLMSDQGATEFWVEVETLSKLRHAHLVSLIGYCNYEKEMILVYEYMPHGTLEDHLHKLHTPLSWLDRLKISIGAARGLDYLHTGTGIDIGVIHRDVKSSNILLHESRAAKISDFGLAKIGPTNQPSTNVYTLVKGTFGYIDPNYFATGKLTRKSDVYAFGVVLFEILCQKRPLDERFERGLATWVQESIKEGNLKQIVYLGIRNEISPKCLKGFARIAERCLNNYPNHRPTMTEVVFSLESLLAQSVLYSQHKTNSWLQISSKKLFGRIFNAFPFSSSGENLGISTSPDEKSGSLISCGENSAGISQITINIATSDSIASPGASSKVPVSGGDAVRPDGLILPHPNLRVFTFAELKTATRNFRRDTVLGEGGFGKVYKAWLDDNLDSSSKHNVVAVKKLNSGSMQGLEEWQKEVEFLGMLSHPNLVKLLGYCYEDRELLLVYEFMQKGSLEKHLFGRGSTVQPLPWNIRLKISIGGARALAFLHTSKKQVIYRDFKASNILLDGSYNAKLSDFGLAKLGPSASQSHVTTRVMGTYGYAAPEYIATGHLYVKSDVYGFGSVLVEMLTGMRALDNQRPANRRNLCDWVKPYLADVRKLKNVMDSRLEGRYPSKAAGKIAQLALTCLSPEPKTRPSMTEVVVKLEQLDAIRFHQKKPLIAPFSLLYPSMSSNRTFERGKSGKKAAKEAAALQSKQPTTAPFSFGGLRDGSSQSNDQNPPSGISNSSLRSSSQISELVDFPPLSYKALQNSSKTINIASSPQTATVWGAAGQGKVGIGGTNTQDLSLGSMEFQINDLEGVGTSKTLNTKKRVSFQLPPKTAVIREAAIHSEIRYVDVNEKQQSTYSYVQLETEQIDDSIIDDSISKNPNSAQNNKPPYWPEKGVAEDAFQLVDEAESSRMPSVRSAGLYGGLEDGLVGLQPTSANNNTTDPTINTTEPIPHLTDPNVQRNDPYYLRNSRKVQEQRTYASISKDATDIFEKGTLRFIPPKVTDSGIKQAVVPVELFAKQAESCSSTLVGYFIDMCPAFTLVKFHANRLWKRFHLKDVILNDQGYFYFTFNTELGLKHVFESSPWFFNDIPILLKRWQPSCWFEKPVPTKVSLWVNIYDMPAILWNYEIISHIVSVIGVPIAIDTYTTEMCEKKTDRAVFARILVEINADQEVPRFVEAEIMGTIRRFRLEFNWIPPKCLHCKIFGHTFFECGVRRRTATAYRNGSKDGKGTSS